MTTTTIPDDVRAYVWDLLHIDEGQNAPEGVYDAAMTLFAPPPNTLDGAADALTAAGIPYDDETFGLSVADGAVLITDDGPPDEPLAVGLYIGGSQGQQPDDTDSATVGEIVDVVRRFVERARA